VLQECYKRALDAAIQGTCVTECYKGVTRVLQECYKSVTRVLQECYKIVTRVLQRFYKGGVGHRDPRDLSCVTRVLQKCCESVARVLQECCKIVTRVLQDFYGTKNTMKLPAANFAHREKRLGLLTYHITLL
jgi:uncharacterized protein (UPF0332 family)